MGLNASKLSKNILSAFKEELQDRWPDVKEYGKAEANKLAQTLVMIEALSAAGKINEEQAGLHLEIQKNAVRTVFLTLEGLGMLAVEAAINAALAVVRDAVNKAMGFALI
jgi:predicted HTH domain antitoxin